MPTAGSQIQNFRNIARNLLLLSVRSRSCKMNSSIATSIILPHCLVTVLQRYRDGVCSLLFPLFFIICQLPSPLHFGVMIFLILVSHIFSYNHWGQAPRKHSGRYRFKKRAIDCARSCCAGKVGVAHDRWRRSLLCHAQTTKIFTGDVRWELMHTSDTRMFGTKISDSFQRGARSLTRLEIRV